MVKLMTKEIGTLNVLQAPAGVWTIDAANTTEGWNSLPPNTFYNEKILDLAGLSKQEKTIFFNGIAQQDDFNPLVVNGSAGDSFYLYDIISSVPIPETSLASVIVNKNFGSNFSGAAFAPIPTFEQTVYFNIREYVIDLDTAAWGSMIMISQNQLGSMQPTASDRLYCYRIVSILPDFSVGATALGVGAVRYVIGTNPMEEKEYQYLMRLKKSYDLQQSFDVDGNRPH